MAKEFRTGFGPLTDIIAWAVFALGVSNLFWMPLAICIGKRPVILISMLVFIGGLIWCFKATTVRSLLGARVLASFGAGCIESLGPSMIADIFRERYFATAMALFAISLSGGSQVGPVIAGYLVANRGWRWFFKLCTILIGANLAFCLFFLPETSYRRLYSYEGETATEIEETAAQMMEHKEEKVVGLEQVLTGTAPGQQYAGTFWKDLFSFKNRGQEETGLRAFPKQFSLPWRFLVVPGALYATLAYGVILGG